ncbi:MAG: hypothetical protein A6D92_24130 [Symbiobacterium thermophilum]|uniref:CdiI immunity protein domain-containing protein n=1 Tax=Symbiobacterium thermophilum TaxID=2734 RepID=A0A1Y2T307_SYMTR|nr:MAG: hypothetical protein A6D92_24130 [Symbiobacterium thermophilum]
MYEFQGRDWTELARAWGISLEHEDDELAARVRHYMRTHVSADATPDPAMVADLRRFVAGFCENARERPDAPLWQGLRDIQHDLTFVQFCDVLLRHMWC